MGLLVVMVAYPKPEPADRGGPVAMVPEDMTVALCCSPLQAVSLLLISEAFGDSIYARRSQTRLPSQSRDSRPSETKQLKASVARDG
jgi:hypothetical protein